MLISTIIRRLVFINQYYNTPIEFPGEEVGQFVQALLQVTLRSRLEANRFKIGPFPRPKRLHEAIFPLHVEDGNQVFEVGQHFLPRVAREILLLVNELSEQLERKYTDFEVTENNWILSHVLRADILSGCDM